MSLEFTVALLIIFSYFLGSIPSAIWYGLTFHKVDIRTKGSGNAGATNTFRVFGKKAGTIVLFLDAGKGFLATYLGSTVAEVYQVDENYQLFLQILFGTLAIIGHLLPIFANFRGGKGVATLIGMVICIHPSVALFSALVFVIVFSLSHYVSLGAIVGAIAFPILLVSEKFRKPNDLLVYFAFFVMGLVIFTHRKNIHRILEGTENKMYLIPRKKKSNS